MNPSVGYAAQDNFIGDVKVDDQRQGGMLLPIRVGSESVNAVTVKGTVVHTSNGYPRACLG